jgi:hypothetical protein
VDAVTRWHDTFDEGHCTLTCREHGRDILISDARAAFVPREFRLTRFAADVFRLLDSPKSLRVLLREAATAREDVAANLLATLFALDQPERPGEERVDFSADDFTTDPDGCLRPLVESGLLYVESAPHPDQRYLALPVREGWRREDKQWIEIGV